MKLEKLEIVVWLKCIFWQSKLLQMIFIIVTYCLIFLLSITAKNAIENQYVNWTLFQICVLYGKGWTKFWYHAFWQKMSRVIHFSGAFRNRNAIVNDIVSNCTWILIVAWFMRGHQRVKLEHHDIKTLNVYNHILKQIFIFYQVSLT